MTNPSSGEPAGWRLPTDEPAATSPQPAGPAAPGPAVPGPTLPGPAVPVSGSSSPGVSGPGVPGPAAVPGAPRPETAGPATGWEAGGPVAASRPTLPSSWGSPVGALLAGLVALVGTWLAGIVLLVLAWLGTVLISDHVDLGELYQRVDVPGVGSGFGSLLKTTIHLVPMALFAPLRVTAHGGGESGAVGVHLPILMLTAVFVALCYLAARRLGRQFTIGSRAGRLAWSLASGVATAAVMMLLGRLAAWSMDDGEAAVHVHTASVGGFFWVLAITCGCVLVGLNHAAGRRLFGNHPLARDAVRALKTFTFHLASLAAALLALGTIWGFVKVAMSDGGGFGKAVGALFELPLVLGHLGTSAFAQANLVPVVVDGNGLGEVGLGISDYADRSLGLFDYPWYVALVMVLLALAAIALAGLFWASRRRVGRVNQQAEIASWCFLPAAYLVGGIVLLVVDRAGITFGGRATSSSLGGGISVHIASWAPLALAVVGLLVELAARYLAPLLGPVVPAQLYRWAGGPSALVTALAGAPVAGVAATSGEAALLANPGGQPAAGSTSSGWTSAGWTSTGATGTGATSAGASPAPSNVTPSNHMPVNPGTGNPAPAGPAPAPLSPQAKARLRRIAMIVGGVLLAIILAAVVISQVNKHSYGPEKQAANLMQAISDGDADRAVTLMGAAAPTGNRSLLTKDVYSTVDDRVSGYTITSTETAGNTATVHVQSTQPSGVSDVVITLSRQGKTDGLFDRWVVSTIGTSGLGLNAPSGASVTINGAKLNLADLQSAADESGGWSLPALPGTYTVTLPDTGKYLKGAQQKVRVGWTQGETATLAPTLTPQFAIDVQAAVNEKIKACEKSTLPSPGGDCPSTYVTPANSVNSWKITSYPVVSVSPELQSDGSYRFTTQTNGQATYNYFEQDYANANAVTPANTTSDISVSGSAKIVDDHVVVTLQ